MFSARETVHNPSGGSRWTAYGLRRDVPLNELIPGRYLLRIEAKAQGDAPAVARETLIAVR